MNLAVQFLALYTQSYSVLPDVFRCIHENVIDQLANQAFQVVLPETAVMINTIVALRGYHPPRQKCDLYNSI